MASWMVHLRIADSLLNKIKNLSHTEFIVGNIAPDSGVPNQDWSSFTPNTDISHFKTTDVDGLKEVNIQEYVNQYFTEKQQKHYNILQRSFYLGYLTHLLADIMWVDAIVHPSKDKFKTLYQKAPTEWIWTMKKDWYDLDYLYMQENPAFRAFTIYKNAVGFQNTFLHFFSEDAFDNRREYITNFYLKGRDNLNREYVYLSKEEMDRFVEKAVLDIDQILKKEVEYVEQKF